MGLSTPFTSDRLNEFKPVPVHDWASHGADAFRYLAGRHATPIEKKAQHGFSGRGFDMPSAEGWMNG